MAEIVDSREILARLRAEKTKSKWRDGLITAKDLQTKTFAPVRIIVPSLIPEGVTILAGKPRLGNHGSRSIYVRPSPLIALSLARQSRSKATLSISRLRTINGD